MLFGLIFFSSSDAPNGDDKYRLVVEATRYADQHDFSSIWIPERHFTKDGWLFPSPAVLQAALARETRRIQLRAGSVVMPLHNPIRVAEEWAIVDNLSGGRVGISFASGWHPNDFAFFPEKYSNRQEEMFRGISEVQRLWRGESINVIAGDGRAAEVKTYPTPVQARLPTWITAAGSAGTFARAGEIGANVLTHMFNHTTEELARKIQLYREALAQNGHDPRAGQVSLMLHTFVHDNPAWVRENAHQAFRTYLKSASYLVSAIAKSRGGDFDLSTLSNDDLDAYVSDMIERFIADGRLLFGTSDSCRAVIRQFAAIGVDEIACQVDFGVETDLVLDSLPYLNRLRERCADLDDFPDFEALEQPRDAGMPRHPEGSLTEIQARCSEQVNGEEFYAALRERGINLGARFQGIQAIWRRDGEAIGKVQPAKADEDDSQSYMLHSTFLDPCLQVLIAAVPTSHTLLARATAYRPVGLRQFRLHRQPTGPVWSHARLNLPTRSSGDVLEGDVRILDEAGDLVVEAAGVRLQRVGAAQRPGDSATPADWLYEVQWRRKPHRDSDSFESASAPSTPGTWLIFARSAGAGDALADHLTGQGDHCLLIRPGHRFSRLSDWEIQMNGGQPEDFDRMLSIVEDVAPEGCRGVVHLWSIESTRSDQLTPTALEAAQELGCGSVLRLVRALARRKWSNQAKVFLVTQGAQTIATTLEGRGPADVAQATLWGFGRTLADELPQQWGGLIDLDSPATDSVEQLSREILRPDGEDQIAFRQGERYVARLVRSAQPASSALAFSLRSDSSYLITGGLGGLGLQIARWMAHRGAGQLVLVDRTTVPPRARWRQIDPASRLGTQLSAIEKIEASGTAVHLVPLDIADEARLRSFLESYRRDGIRPIRGVIHAAAVMHGGTLLTVDDTTFDEGLRPKVIGGWVLHQLFRSADLDFFVLLSAASAILGRLGHGGAHEAAANSFLDALSYLRREAGLPSLSVDFGPWREVRQADGMSYVLDRLAQSGVGSLTPDQGLATLELLFGQGASAPPQVMPIAVNWSQFFRARSSAVSSALLSDLFRETSTSRGSPARLPSTGQIGRAVRALPADDRQGMLENYARNKLAGALRLDSSSIDRHQPLNDLGLDSMMAIELRNDMDADLGIQLPMASFFRSGSVAELASEVLELLQASRADHAEADGALSQTEQHTPANRVPQIRTGVSGNTDELLAAVDDLSSEEVDQLLKELLG